MQRWLLGFQLWCSDQNSDCERTLTPCITQNSNQTKSIGTAPHALTLSLTGVSGLQLRSQVGEGRCFSVNCSEKAKEQALQVLKHFNVQVSLSDIFSRCQVGRGWLELRLLPAHRSLRCLGVLGLALGVFLVPKSSA